MLSNEQGVKWKGSLTLVLTPKAARCMVEDDSCVVLGKETALPPTLN
jgi:hypothetical protein